MFASFVITFEPIKISTSTEAPQMTVGTSDLWKIFKKMPKYDKQKVEKWPFVSCKFMETVSRHWTFVFQKMEKFYSL